MIEQESAPPLLLLVDDVPRNLQLLCSILRPAGYQLSLATGSTQALAILEKTVPDLILLDVMMPGMDGFSLCRILKEQQRFKHIPVIFLTARKEQEDITAGFDAGGVDYIGKPFHAAELTARIRTQLEMKLLRDRLQQQNRTLETQNRRMIDQLELAKKLQWTLLPVVFPEQCGLGFFTEFIPSERLSGDLYYAEQLADGRTAWFVADVSGHGVSSAMVTFFIREAVQSVHSSAAGFSPADLAAEINRRMLRLRLQTEDNIWYFTFFYCIYDKGTGRLAYSCAGHEPAYLIRARERTVQRISYPSLPVGWFEQAEYENRELLLEPGDGVVLGSDGLLEQMVSGEKFGEERLCRAIEIYLQEHGAVDSGLTAAVIGDIYRFAGTQDLDDDVTMVTAVRNGKKGKEGAQ